MREAAKWCAAAAGRSGLGADEGRIERCLKLFEDYCVVTQSVRAGLDVSVEVNAEAEAVAGQP